MVDQSYYERKIVKKNKGVNWTLVLDKYDFGLIKLIGTTENTDFFGHPNQ